MGPIERLFRKKRSRGESSSCPNQHIHFDSDDEPAEESEHSHTTGHISVDSGSQPSEHTAHTPMVHVLNTVQDLNLQSDRERQAFNILIEREFVLTRVIGHNLLNRTGMTTEFQSIFHTLGWANAYHVFEQGSKWNFCAP